MNRNAIENTFRNSSDSDELFDAFNFALLHQIDDIELYKILLANSILTDDELIMYTEKLCSEFTQNRFDILIWTAKIFETKSFTPDITEKSLHYYAKAAKSNPTDHRPYISALNLYNYEINFAINNQILQFVESAFAIVNRKSLVYEKLSKHYKKLGANVLASKYLKLAQQTARNE